ncbi:tetratricopeptide repeat protein [Deferribacterales bacterium Es71-Z0220]|uniref:tetratricopeptide repeat protein n=1 Tax=Deferrivibrio essentukiensis TaxID=2880922 RepID=UPI001F60B2D8|nr:tetratricopeptide repeat protein [Deferrivibrio essentukiensis]MCB4203866.1 tetratricopeptide repeat protein [Deferrivibrio essentukiensis]
MRKIFLTFAILTISNIHLFAGEILIKQLSFATELLLKIENINIIDSKVDNGTATITFNKNLDIKVDNIKDNFIENIRSINNQLIINLKTPASIDAIAGKKEVKVFITKRKINNNFNIQNTIENPKAVVGKEIIKDPAAESELLAIKNKIENEDYQNAINQINDFINKHGNDIYGQEAYFLLGKAYMGLGKFSDRNYVQASAIFEDFAKRYSNSYLYIDALWNSAIAKESAGLYFEAVFEYRNIINAMPDTELAKKAYEKIGQIYENIGQYDKAIESYREMLSKFQVDNIKLYAKIGMLYNQLKDTNAAYEYFSKILDSDIEYNELGEDILYNFASILEKKEFYDKAISIYEKIYNLYPEGKYADLAMFKAAEILEKTGKDKLADQLYLDAKNKYFNKKGGQLSAVRYAKKYLERNITDYWLEFLRDVLNSDIDVNIKSEGYLLIIQSYFREKMFDNALEYIKIFESSFFDSPYLSQAYDVKQKIYMENAKNYFKNSNLDMAKNELSKLLNEFPDTKFKKEINSILEDIRYNEILALLNDRKYHDVIDQAQTYMATNKELTNADRWKELLDITYYEYITMLDSTGNIDTTLLFLKEYFINIENGKHSNKLKEILNSNLLHKFSKLAEESNHIDILKTYHDNISWLKYLTESTKDSIFSYVAYAYYSLGEIQKAKKIIQNIKGVKNNDIFIIKMLLNENTADYDINKLDINQIKFLANEFYKTNPIKGINELRKYTVNRELAYILRAKMINKINDSLIVENFYNEIFDYNNYTSQEIIRFLLNGGIYFYNTNNYDKSKQFFEKIIALKKVDDNILGDSHYYLGKIHLQNRDEENALKHFNEVSIKYKNSSFYKEAVMELEDLNWKKKLRNQ